MPQMVLPIFPSDVTLINSRIGFVQREGTVYYFHGAFPVFSHSSRDMESFRFITSQLVVNSNATQAEVVRAFGISAISVKRYVKRLREGGPGRFFRKAGKRSATVLTSDVLEDAQRLLDNARTVREAAEILGIKECTVRKAIDQGRLKRSKKK